MLPDKGGAEKSLFQPVLPGKPLLSLKNYTTILTFILMLVNAVCIDTAAQDRVDDDPHASGLDSFILSKYSLDQNLINGVQYYNRYYRVRGHPDLYNDSQTGSVTLSGVRYDNVRINYDIYNQYLILDFTGKGNGKNRLIIPPVLTQAFQLGDSNFEKLNPDHKEPEFYQIIGVDSLRFLIHYSKLLINYTNDLRNTGYFTEPDRTYYLEYKGEVYSITKRTSLIELFPATYRKEIRKYMRVRMVNLKKATPGELNDLLNFLSLLEIKSSEP